MKVTTKQVSETRILLDLSVDEAELIRRHLTYARMDEGQTESITRSEIKLTLQTALNKIHAAP